MAERKVKVYGCHNREPLAESLLVQDGWIWKYREPKLKTIKVEMTKDCQYTLSDLGQRDAKCDGCKWRASPASAPAHSPSGCSTASKT